MQKDQPTVPDLLDSPPRTESHGTQAFEKTSRARRESFTPISVPVDHVALVASIEALAKTFPALLDGYRKSLLPPMLEHLLAFHGVQEIKGPLSSAIIGGWIMELAGAAGPVQDDNAEWCCLPTSLACMRSGYPLPRNASWSRSWASWGAPVSPGDERLGDVVVLSRGRPEAEKGHLGLAVKWDPHFVAVLGGNTQDAVQVGWYDRVSRIDRGSRIIAVRRPVALWLEEEYPAWPEIGGLDVIMPTT